jgi:hypothetical protein
MQAEAGHVGASGFLFASAIFRLNLKSYDCNRNVSGRGGLAESPPVCSCGLRIHLIFPLQKAGAA